MNATISLTVDLTNPEVVKAVAAFMKAIESASGSKTFVDPAPVQKTLIAVNPETGFVPDPSKVVDPEEALKIAYKVNPELSTFDPERHGKNGKKAKKVSNRAPLTEVEKAIIRIRLLKGRLAKATGEDKAKYQAMIAKYEAVVAQDKKDGDKFLNELAARGSKKVEPDSGDQVHQLVLQLQKATDPKEIKKLNSKLDKLTAALNLPTFEEAKGKFGSILTGDKDGKKAAALRAKTEAAVEGTGVLVETHYADGSVKYTREHSAGITPGTPEADAKIKNAKARIAAEKLAKKQAEEKAAVEAYEKAQAEIAAKKAARKSAKKSNK